MVSGQILPPQEQMPLATQTVSTLVVAHSPERIISGEAEVPNQLKTFVGNPSEWDRLVACSSATTPQTLKLWASTSSDPNNQEDLQDQVLSLEELSARLAIITPTPVELACPQNAIRELFQDNLNTFEAINMIKDRNLELKRAAPSEMLPTLGEFEQDLENVTSSILIVLRCQINLDANRSSEERWKYKWDKTENRLKNLSNVFH